MSEKRKDSRGRNLKTGESQRANGQYIYQYQNAKGERKVVYSWRLVPTDKIPEGKRQDLSLREKIKNINAEIEKGVYCDDKLTVIELVEKYISQRQDVRYNTKVGYKFVLNLIKKEEFCYRKIGTIRVVEAKEWIKKLYADGRGCSTITSVRGVLKLAFQMAVDEDLLLKNPFAFRLDVIPNTSQKREALTKEVEQKYLEFVQADSYYEKYYDEIIILLGTGMRISEFVGLTINDIDFKNKKIHINKQLTRTRKGIEYYIEEPKTEAGERYIPMTKVVKQAFENLIKKRKNPKTEMIINGYSRFLMIDQRGKPKVAMHIEHVMKRIVDKYNESHEDKLPAITPHVLRHTFCTRMANSGMNPKTLQYIMGHSDISVTLGVYTHADMDKVSEEMYSIEQKQAQA